MARISTPEDYGLRIIVYNIFSNMENKVVKCNRSQCGQYFMHTEKNTKCPFCHTEYGETVEEKTASSTEASAAKKEKKGTTKTQKDSFKIWKNN